MEIGNVSWNAISLFKQSLYDQGGNDDYKCGEDLKAGDDWKRDP